MSRPMGVDRILTPVARFVNTVSGDLFREMSILRENSWVFLSLTFYLG
mgnify:CR=1 FL=1